MFLLFCECFFFRNILGNELLFGDTGDGRLTTLVAEHWWHFLCGHEKFSELAIFFPHTNALAYSDMLLVFGMLHSLLRLLHFDMYMAYKYTLILVHIFGTFSLFYLCCRKFKMSVLWSIGAVLAFSFSTSYALICNHTQMLGISLVPILCVWLVDCIQKYIHHQNYHKSALLFVCGFVLLLYNSWYVAYFNLIFALIFAVVYVCQMYLNHLSFKPFMTAFYTLKLKLAGYMLISAILLLPFYRIYMPIMDSSGGFNYENTKSCLPELIDLINVGEENWLFGWFIQYLGLVQRSYSEELMIGFSVILLLLYAVTFVVGFQKINLKLNAPQTSAQNKYTLIAVNSVFIGILICLILVIRLTPDGWSLWYFVFEFVPGARAVRAVARFVFVLSLPMSIISAYTADKFIKLSHKKATATALLMIAAIWLSGINKNGIRAGWERRQQQQFLAQVATPPKDVEVFYIRAKQVGIYEQMNAFEIANFYGLKTINGYSGSVPKNWQYVFGKDYEGIVRNWVLNHNLQNVYAYDIEQNKWQSVMQTLLSSMTYSIGQDILFRQNGNGEKYTLEGFSYPEAKHTWTIGPKARLQLFIRHSKPENLKMTFKGWPFTAGELKQQIVHVYVNQQLVETWQMEKRGIYTAVIPSALVTSGDIKIEFEISNPMSPQQLKISEDGRNLGIAFEKLVLMPLTNNP